MAGSVQALVNERFDLTDRDQLVADPRDGAKDAASNQPVDGRLADAEGLGGFLDGIRQAANVGCG